jgi:hypothetical protein
MPRPKDKSAAPRKKGEGSSWKDEAGFHHWRITVNGVRFEVADRDPDRALSRFNELKENLKKGIRVRDAQQSLSSYAEYVHNTRLGGSESTRFDRLKRINSYIAPVLGERRLCDLDTPLLWEWWNIVKKEYAYNSAKQALSLLKRILDLAVIDRLLPNNPAQPIKPEQHRKATTITDVPAWKDADEDRRGVGKVMTLEQVETLLKAVAGHWLEPLYTLAFLGVATRRTLRYSLARLRSGWTAFAHCPAGHRPRRWQAPHYDAEDGHVATIHIPDDRLLPDARLSPHRVERLEGKGC